jgi:unsaturated chondroitin disaccharide hydrolase
MFPHWIKSLKKVLMQIQHQLQPVDLKPALEFFWGLSAEKLRLLRDRYDGSQGSPVFTSEGKYTTRGWTEWTQGFQFGSEIIQFDATGENRFLESGRESTLRLMAPHITHTGVHDHGFNNVSTYGALRRLVAEGRIDSCRWEREFYDLALKCTGAVQAMRWTETAGGGGYVYSFNGPHSLFVDTIRSMRALAISHRLGHALFSEHDRKISLLGRMLRHIESTARYNVYYGEGRDEYDLSGRTVHEAIFNINDGCFRCPSSQQGYSPFTTWTRGLAWAICGFAEQLEFLEVIDDESLESMGGRARLDQLMLRAARATSDFYIENTWLDGIPCWDTGAPGIEKLGDYTKTNADPWNDHEPVDSSAAAIAAHGLLRLGRLLAQRGRRQEGNRYRQAGLTVCRTLLGDPYLSRDKDHEGLLLHSVYHRPNGWDHVPAGKKVPCNESSMWGDYHMRELALYLWRIIKGDPYYTFFAGTGENQQT